MRKIYGNNFQWQHGIVISANDRMLMTYRFRIGLSQAWPYHTYIPQN